MPPPVNPPSNTPLVDLNNLDEAVKLSNNLTAVFNQAAAASVKQLDQIIKLSDDLSSNIISAGAHQNILLKDFNGSLVELTKLDWSKQVIEAQTKLSSLTGKIVHTKEDLATLAAKEALGQKLIQVELSRRANLEQQLIEQNREKTKWLTYQSSLNNIISDDEAKQLLRLQKYSDKFKTVINHQRTWTKELTETEKQAHNLADWTLKWTNSLAKLSPISLPVNAIFPNINDVSRNLKHNLGQSFDTFKKGGTSLSDTFKDVLGHIKGANKELLMGMSGAIVVAVSFAALILMALHRYWEIDKAAENFRKKTGILNSQMGNMWETIEGMSREYARFGVKVEDVADAAAALVNTFSGSMDAVKPFVVETALLSKNFAVAEDVSAKVFQNIMGMSGSSTDGAKAITGFAMQLAKAARVPIKQVMEDVASASESALTAVRANVGELIKGAVSARRMGTSLETLASSAHSLLDFQSSINNEMEASVLLGKNLNFQRARELAYRGDISGLATEQMRMLNSIGGLEGKNVYQIESYAKAAGMSVDALMKMNAQQEILKYASADVKKEYEDGMKVFDSQVNIVQKLKEKLKNLPNGAERLSIEKQLQDISNKSLRDDLKKQEMQGKMAQIQGEFAAMWLQVQDALLPIVKVLVPVFVSLLKLISPIVSTIVKGFSGLIKPFNKFVPLAEDLNAYMDKWSPIMDDFGDKLSMASSLFITMLAPAKLIFGLLTKTASLGSVFSGIAGVFRTGLSFGKVIPVLGEVIMLIQGIVSAFQRFPKIWAGLSEAFSGNFEGGIMKVLYQMGGIIYDVLVDPFVQAANWIGSLVGDEWKDIGTHIFQAISLGMGGILNLVYAMVKSTVGAVMSIPEAFISGMTNGLDSVGPILYKAIIQPFVDWWNSPFIQAMLGHSPSKFGMMIVNGIKAVGGLIFDFMISPFVDSYKLINNVFSSIVSIGGTIFSSLYDVIISPFKTAYDFVSSLWNGTSMFSGLISFIGTMVSIIFGALISPYKMAYDYISSMWSGDSISSVFSGIGSAVLGPITSSITTATKMFGDFKDWISNLFSGIKLPDILGMGKDAITGVGNLASGITSSITKDVTSLVNQGTNLVTSLANSDITTTISEGLSKAFNGTIDTIKSVGSNLANPIADISGLGDSIKSAIFGNEDPINDDKKKENPNARVEDLLESALKLNAELVGLLKAGKISVNMDGKKVSAAVASAISSS